MQPLIATVWTLVIHLAHRSNLLHESTTAEGTWIVAQVDDEAFDSPVLCHVEGINDGPGAFGAEVMQAQVADSGAVSQPYQCLHACHRHICLFCVTQNEANLEKIIIEEQEEDDNNQTENWSECTLKARLLMCAALTPKQQ